MAKKSDVLTELPQGVEQWKPPMIEERQVFGEQGTIIGKQVIGEGDPLFVPLQSSVVEHQSPTERRVLGFIRVRR